MIHLDSSVLIDALTGPRRSAVRLRARVRMGDRVGVSTLVLCEWWRGPRNERELEIQEALFPRAHAAVFGAEEAARAADLYRRVKRPRGREIDLAIAACALTQGASLWTLNPDDFADLPGLMLA